MADITPGVTHYISLGNSLCGIECTSDWDDDDDAEFVYTYKEKDVDCENCIRRLKDGR